jgi:hypothetical protein
MTVDLYYLDITNSQNFDICTSTNLGGGVVITYDHTSTEWINEWPGGRPGPYYYEDPGTITFTDQLFSDSFNNGGTWKSPFSGAFTAWDLIYASSSASPPCSSKDLLAYPEDPSTNSSGGTSKIVTCIVPSIDG